MGDEQTDAGRTWDLWAHRSRGTHWHVGTKRWVELHGLKDPVVSVLVEDWTGDVRAPEVTHYGWEDTEKPGKVTMIWPRASRDADADPWMLLGLCFGCAIEDEVKRGRGRMLALRVTERDDQERDDQARPPDRGVES